MQLRVGAGDSSMSSPNRTRNRTTYGSGAQWQTRDLTEGYPLKISPPLRVEKADREGVAYFKVKYEEQAGMQVFPFLENDAPQPQTKSQSLL